MLAIQQRDAFLLADKDLVTQLFKESEKQLCPIESIVSNLSGRAFQRSPLSCTCFLLHVQVILQNYSHLFSKKDVGIPKLFLTVQPFARTAVLSTYTSATQAAKEFHTAEY